MASSQPLPDFFAPPKPHHHVVRLVVLVVVLAAIVLGIWLYSNVFSSSTSNSSSENTILNDRFPNSGSIVNLSPAESAQKKEDVESLDTTSVKLTPEQSKAKEEELKKLLELK